MENQDTFDIIVIGGGPGGYVAAIRAGQLGKKVALIECEHVGGICLNWGCIPTKALLKSSDLYRHIKHAREFGLSFGGEISFDTKLIFERSREVSRKLVSGIHYLLKKNKVNLIEGWAQLESSQGGKRCVGLYAHKDRHKKLKTLVAEDIILATGARARPFHCEKQVKGLWYYKQALAPDIFPKRLIVVGSGAIGVEFASFYNTFGVHVTLLETADYILTTEDRHISELAQKAFEKQGMVIHTGAHIQTLHNKKNGSIHVDFIKNGQTEHLEADRVLMAIGVIPNTENLGLEELQIEKTSAGFVKIDSFGSTSIPHIWAIGDIAGSPCLAHKASHEGVLVVERIAGLSSEILNRKSIPGCIYTYPQIASVGLTEEEAKKTNRPLKIGQFPFIGNGKAIAMNEPEGLIKTIFDKQTGELLGAHMIGADVTELIGAYTIAQTLEATDEDIAQTIFPHPTLSEMLHEATLSALGSALHI